MLRLNAQITPTTVATRPESVPTTNPRKSDLSHSGARAHHGLMVFTVFVTPVLPRGVGRAPTGGRIHQRQREDGSVASRELGKRTPHGDVAARLSAIRLFGAQ